MGSGLFEIDLTLTLFVASASLAVVCIPLYRGLRIAFQALGATRFVEALEIERCLKQGAAQKAEGVTLQMLRVLRSALRENKEAPHPTEFLIDASRQYVSNEYEAHFARPISMYANILPPIGFIGTTGGLLILFLSMRVASDSLELGALAMALTSSIFALVAFALLEGFKIRLYQRMLARIDDALLFYRRAARGAGAAAE